MTKEELLAMAWEAGMKDSLMYEHIKCDAESLAAFAKLLAQREREACWNDISIALLGSDRELTKRVFKAIRARGQA